MTKVETVRPIRLRCNGQNRDVPAWTILTLSEVQAERLLRKAPAFVRRVLPIPPLRPGWLIAYRDRQGLLHGGCDDRNHGTVHECHWTGTTWMIALTNGESLPLGRIVSVGKTDAMGKVVAAWTVKQHGYDGEGR